MSEFVATTPIQVAAPRCYVEVYPFEGGMYVLSGDAAGVLSVTVTKNIRATDPGSFTLNLVPGGPNGVNGSPQWLDILTPMSLVLIGMERAGVQSIVMVGVVLGAGESEVWTANGVRRALQISGQDFAYFFTQANYFTLTLLSGSYLSAEGVPNALSSIDPGLLFASPDKLAAAWYSNIMAGPNSIMAQTQFPYQKTRLTLFQMLTTHFEPFDYVDLQIPSAESFMIAEGSWQSKFMQFFPFPWYEFFVITAPPGTYSAVDGQQTGIPLSMVSMPKAPAVTPTVVGRVNPLPWTQDTGGTGAAPTFTMTYANWDKLPITDLSSKLPLQQSMVFSTDEVRNYYVTIPRYSLNLIGAGNDQQSPFVYLFGAWIDIASVHRYGFRPQVSELQWFCDPSGSASQKNAALNKSIEDYQLMYAAIALRQTSYFEPTPLMARSSLVTNLRPDIMPGTRCAYTPFKDTEIWDFYIEGVSHTYTFGGPSTTTLSLSRGLPRSVYTNQALMLDIHTGNAVRQNGTYVSGLPSGLGKPLQPLNVFTIQGNILGEIAAVFATPGQK